MDDFHRNNKLGSIFELAVRKGKLLVCGYKLKTDLPVARQLRNSLLNYMNTEEFAPSQEVSYNWLEELLPRNP